MTSSSIDAVVIGGGFYGCAIALFLRNELGLKDIVILEREAALMRRASYSNQARVHNGYHYPRSFTTAYRSRRNLPRFMQDWSSAIHRDFTKVYAIARRNSQVTARQFRHFCKEIGASLEPADAGVKELFEPRLIEEVFVAEEFAFDAARLTQLVLEQLTASNIQVMCGSEVGAVRKDGQGQLAVHVRSPSGEEAPLVTPVVFNCTYSGLNQVGGDFHGTTTRIHHEIAELALIEVPALLQNLGVTVLDGPFFSCMPFPPRGLHTLSHVRYTPHQSFSDSAGRSPYEVLDRYDKATQVERMIRDAARYLPAIADSKFGDSLFEVKTILEKSERDDSRPILFERSPTLPGFYSILGGKIDNIYDMFEQLREEPLARQLPSLGSRGG